MSINSAGNSAQEYQLSALPPIPEAPAPKPVDSVPLGDSAAFPEVKMEFPIADGPFQPTWRSINENCPDEVQWLRDSKFGIWVHFGPQSAGESGDWYARNLYKEGEQPYRNHLKNFGHPSEVGYKDVLREWNPDKLDPARLVQIYHDAGARFLLIQGVHHDNFDLWNSRYHPWNSMRIGPKRDLLGEWAKACRAAGMHYGVAFHHEYTWWWWQAAFGSDKHGAKTGVPYDGNLTLADGVGKWWEGLDPRLLYGIDLREYKSVDRAAHTGWSPPDDGIFFNHLAYAHWYALQWSLRIIDVVEHYDPDFIYTDGTGPQPFSGDHTGTGYKCDAMQRVIAHYYNRTLQRRGKPDTFSIVKFHGPDNGVLTTFENNYPRDIKHDQPWIGDMPVGDWFYAPGFYYDPSIVVRYLLECVSRDGGAAICVSLLPDGSLDEGSTRMLKEIGEWMRINGEGIYGSHAWIRAGEDGDIDANLKALPYGKLGRHQADFPFSTQDFRFTVGADGSLYAYCMAVPSPGQKIRIVSLGDDSGLERGAIQSVSLLGCDADIQWQQQDDGLVITCPNMMPFRIAVCFKVRLNKSLNIMPPSDLEANIAPGQVILRWRHASPSDTYDIMRAQNSNGPFETIASGIKEKRYTDLSAKLGILYFYKVSARNDAGRSMYSSLVSAAVPGSLNLEWMSQDIGPVGIAGSYARSGDVYTVRGSGSDIWNSSDEFGFVFKALAGNFTLTARVQSMDNTAPWAKAGVMIRDTLNADSKYALCFVSPTQGIAFQQRSETGRASSGAAEAKNTHAPGWVRLLRQGDTVSAYYSMNGADWISMGSCNISMSDSLYAGLAVCSVNNGSICQAQFTDVSIEP